MSTVTKTGYTFRNYQVAPNEWGRVLTADDLRYTYLWGVDLKASDVLATEVEDSQLDWCVEEALAAFENYFNLDIRKRVYKVDPADSLIRKPVWTQGVDYTDEETAYDFNKEQWRNFGFLRLRHRPLISLDTAVLRDRLGNQVLDIKDWARLDKRTGQVHFYPKGVYTLKSGYGGTGVFAAWAGMFNNNYPHAIKVEYTTGYYSSDFVPNDLRGAIGLFAALVALAWVGDGLMAGFSSSSISLDGLSESFSSTQSATSAYFGARIEDYKKRIAEFLKNNKYKYGNIPIAFVGG